MSESPCFLLNKNINFNKNKRESEMENPILHDKLELLKEKRGHCLYCLFCPKEIFLTFVFYPNL